MSGPYVYSPHNAPALDFFSNAYHYPSPNYSPYVPDLPLSPYHSPNPGTLSLPGTPRSGNKVLFPNEYEQWLSPAPMGRERTVSWGNPVVEGVTHASQLVPPEEYTHRRRHSSEIHARPSMQVYSPHTPTHSSVFFPQLHPFLNGSAPRSDFMFDLSAKEFRPMKVWAPGQMAQFATDQLRELATDPPVSRLRIICDIIPQWPIDVSYPRPITFGDILYVTHRFLHTRISQRDWMGLRRDEAKRLTYYFDQRCQKTGAEHGGWGAGQWGCEQERMDGVKKVDFLCGKVMFRGLVPVSGDVVKLIVS